MAVGRRRSGTTGWLREADLPSPGDCRRRRLPLSSRRGTPRQLRLRTSPPGSPSSTNKTNTDTFHSTPVQYSQWIFYYISNTNIFYNFCFASKLWLKFADMQRSSKPYAQQFTYKGHSAIRYFDSFEREPSTRKIVNNIRLDLMQLKL